MDTTDHSQRVAVLGAASWVGQQVCAALAVAGWQVTAVTRAKSSLIVERLPVRVRIAGSRNTAERFPVVINLAFPMEHVDADARSVNQELLTEIKRLAAPGARIVHFSTVAVFGMAFDLPATVEFAPRHRDDPYVEMKLEMEHFLSAAFHDQELHIIRLGNVWGPASLNWVVGPVNRLRLGLPLAVRGRDGFSNVTDVANVADYTVTLLRGRRGRRVHFHHLAEFGEHRWSEFFGFLARETGHAIVVASPPPEATASLGAELRWGLVAGLNACRLTWWHGRYSGSVYRQLRRWIPQVIRHLRPAREKEAAASFAYEASADPADWPFLRLIACSTRFASSTLPEWRPPIDLGLSLSRVRAWLCESGCVPERRLD